MFLPNSIPIGFIFLIIQKKKRVGSFPKKKKWNQQLLNCNKHGPPPPRHSSRRTAVTLPSAFERALGDEVQLVFLLVQLVMSRPETHARNGRQHGDDPIIPDQQRIRRQRDKRFANGVRDGAHEQEHGRDDRAHVLGRLGEGVFQTGDGSKDLGEGDQ